MFTSPNYPAVHRDLLSCSLELSTVGNADKIQALVCKLITFEYVLNQMPGRGTGKTRNNKRFFKDVGAQAMENSMAIIFKRFCRLPWKSVLCKEPCLRINISKRSVRLIEYLLLC